MSENRFSQAAVEKCLAEFKDPETGRSITRLEQIHDLKVDGQQIAITLGLTTWSAPLWEATRARLVETVREKFPAAEVTVQVEVHNRPPEPAGELAVTAKSVIAVGSGKGGVGKSSIAATLAFGLARAGCQVGLMDADVYGPSIPHLLGTTERPTLLNNRIQPIVVDGLKVLSMGLLVPPGEAVIWRGPMLHNYLKQFLGDTDWGDLDYLIVDMPPGTGDVALSLSELLPASGAVVVCTPQDVALLDAVKAIAMFGKVKINVLGVVENMSFFLCPNCNSRHDIFGSGGAKKKAEELGVPFLGEVPINVAFRELGDTGRIAAAFDDEAIRPHLEAICHKVVADLSAAQIRQPSMPSLSVLK